jgi:outer membrane protein OmpA-like peptidoglycan-associated protein
MTLLVVPATIALLAGCTTDLQKHNALLTKENGDLRLQLGERNSALADAQQELRDKDLEISQLRRNLENGQQPLAQVTGFEEIPNVSTAFGAGEITVAVESDVLFASGKASLKSAAKQSLDDVATVLNRSYADHLIRVAGHTDSDPIRKSGYKSNYHLGFERAYAVRDYLVTRGVDAQRVSTASYGPDQPLTTKAASRRVEIVVVTEP